MPLSERQKQLLYEIYGVSYSQKTVTTSGGGFTPTPTLFDVRSGVKQQLVEAIAFIDTEESRVARVAEILEEYDAIALDFSTIDREGYSMRPSRNLKRIHEALYAHTGIFFQKNQANNILLG
jgi:hypothetical protein